MYRARRIDANQPMIVDALRRIGAKVAFLHELGNDVPDLLVGFRGRNVLLEIKMPKKDPTSGQQVWANNWPGEVHVVHSVNEALQAVVGKEAMR